MSAGLRLGAVPYLNAEPLVWPLEKGVVEHPHTIIRAFPGELVDMLAAGKLDCALAPIASLIDHPHLIPIPGVAIACRGAVASVLLFHKDPLEHLKTIWLDPASRTSNILVQILRSRFSQRMCKFPIPDGDDAPAVDNLPERTGRLIIGDAALALTMDTDSAGYSDLGELWKKITNHPFTFARWIAVDGDIAADLGGLVREARDWSLLHLHEMVGPLAEKMGYPIELVDHYLRINISYMHGPREQAGEREFFTQAENYLGKRGTESDA